MCCLCTVVLSGATPPTLSAASLSPNTAPNLTAYFAEGEATSPLLTGLPSCVIFAQNGSFLELYNVDTGFVAGRHGPFDNRPGIGSLASTGVLWNTTANPVLDTSYTGLYRCRADTSTSSGFYQLNVRGKFTILLLETNALCVCIIRAIAGLKQDMMLTKWNSLPKSFF